MLLSDLKEMTMRAGSYEGLGRYIGQFQKYIDSNNFVGDLETFKVFGNGTSDHTKNYVVANGNAPIAFFQTINGNELTTAYVLPEYRKQGIFSMFLVFLKRVEHFNRIILGDLHSEDTIKAVQRIYKRFNTFWFDGTKKIPYDPETIDQFYGLTTKTPWKIILENDYDWSDWPTEWNPLDLRTWYSGLLDINRE